MALIIPSQKQSASNDQSLFFSGKNIEKSTLSAGLPRIVIMMNIKEYKLLPAYYVQKAKYAALMDEKGILGRDEIFDKGLKNQVAQDWYMECLFTLTPNAQSSLIYDKEAQMLRIRDLGTKELQKEIPFPVRSDQHINLNYNDHKRGQPIHNDNFVVFTIHALCKNRISENQDYPYSHEDYYVLDIQQGTTIKLTPPNTDSSQIEDLTDKAEKLKEKRNAIQEKITSIEAEEVEKETPSLSLLREELTTFNTQILSYLNKINVLKTLYSLNVGSSISPADYFFREGQINQIHFTRRASVGMKKEYVMHTQILSFDLLSQEWRITHVIPSDLFSVYLDEHLKPSMGIMMNDKMQQVIIRLDDALKAIEVQKVKIDRGYFSEKAEIVGKNQLLVLTQSQSDKRAPVLRTVFPIRSDQALLTVPQEESLKADVKYAELNPRNTSEMCLYINEPGAPTLHIKKPDGRYEAHPDMFSPSYSSNENTSTEDLAVLIKEATQSLGDNIRYLERDENGHRNYYVYSPSEGGQKEKLQKVFSQPIDRGHYQKTIDKLSKTKSFTFLARDGLEIQAYLTLPNNAKEQKNLPTMLLVHGGPMTRDKNKFSPEVQFWASQFAVLQVNFRGSVGFGKKFTKSAWGDWHGKMTEDLIDGLDVLKKKGIADPGRVVISGASYGGFAVLSALTRYPGVFKCGVALNGEYDLLEALREMQNCKTESDIVYFAKQFGVKLNELNQVETIKKLKKQSPLHDVHKMSDPLLVISGSEDETCHPDQSTTLRKKAQILGKHITHIEFKNMGHSPNQEDSITIHGLAENFIAQHVPGIFAEPIERDFDQNPNVRLKLRAGHTD